MRESISIELKDRLVIKVKKAKTVEMVKRAMELNDAESQYCIPCFEIWMNVYFGEMPAVRESYIYCERFAEKFEKVTGKNYFKN